MTEGQASVTTVGWGHVFLPCQTTVSKQLVFKKKVLKNYSIDSLDIILWMLKSHYLVHSLVNYKWKPQNLYYNLF
jgi:hypothetical protein